VASGLEWTPTRFRIEKQWIDLGTGEMQEASEAELVEDRQEAVAA
jgi:hypothetical protein